MNEKKQPQDEVASSEMIKPLNQNQIHQQASLLGQSIQAVRLQTPANDYIGRKAYQKEISLWNDETRRQELLNGDLSLIKIISISAVTSFIVTLIIWLIS